jgi:hypothetical protein
MKKKVFWQNKGLMLTGHAEENTDKIILKKCGNMTGTARKAYPNNPL